MTATPFVKERLRQAQSEFRGISESKRRFCGKAQPASAKVATNESIEDIKMRTALDALPTTLDEKERSFVSRLRQHGWFCTSVSEDEQTPRFSYTTGFWLSANHPELITFSMKSEIAHDIFWHVFRDAKDGCPLTVGKRTDAVFANLPAYAFPIAKKYYANLLGWSRWFYAGDEFSCLQIVWPDRAGLFPWENGFDVQFQADQLDLTEQGWKSYIAS
jgi:hypothetical protein